MNKKAFSFKLAFYAIVIVGFMITAIGAIISDWNNTYDSGLDYDLDDLNRNSEVETTAQEYESAITVKSTNTGEEFEGTSIRGVFGVLNRVREGLRVVLGDNGIVENTMERFGVPGYIVNNYLLIASFAIVFSLVIIFFRLPRRNA